MSQLYTDPDESNQDELERLLIQGPGAVQSNRGEQKNVSPPSIEEDDENTEVRTVGAISLPGEEVCPDVQDALGLFAEATQDMATAGVELGLGRHFACVDFCNQAVEKAAQAVSLLRFGRRSMYDHDLGALGALVGAPKEIQDEMATLTPFHPEEFYADTPPEEADEVISAEQASGYVYTARHVLKWARNIVLS